MNYYDDDREEEQIGIFGQILNGILLWLAITLGIKFLKGLFRDD